MSSFSSSGGSSNNNTSNAHVGERTAQVRESYIKNKQGDAVGSNWQVGKADFGAFLGYKAPTAGELSGKTPVSGRRVIEIQLQQDFNKIGQQAAAFGEDHRNMFVAQGSFANKRGREGDAIKDGMDSVRMSVNRNSSAATEKKSDPGTPALGGTAMTQYMAKVESSQARTRNDNMKMLEIQYKLQELSKQDSTISNLMKTRHEAVSRVIRGGGQ